VPGDASVRPVYVEAHLSELRNPGTAEESWQAPRAIRAIAIDPDAPELRPADLGIDPAVLQRLREPGAVLFDAASKPDPRHPGSSVFGDLRVGTETELAGKRIRVVGMLRLGSDSLADGTLLVSHATFADHPPAVLSGDRSRTGLAWRAEAAQISSFRTPRALRERAESSRGRTDRPRKGFLLGMTLRRLIRSAPGWGLVGLVVCTVWRATCDHLPETPRCGRWPRAYRVDRLREAVYLTIGGHAGRSWLVFRVLRNGLAMI
jgi:hypothetical protein